MIGVEVRRDEAMVGEASGELGDESGAQIDFPQKEDAPIGADVAPLEIRLYFVAAEILKGKGLPDTVRHAAAGGMRAIFLEHQRVTTKSKPSASFSMRND